MSAAAARRRKQKLQKAKEEEAASASSATSSEDAVVSRLNALLTDDSASEESVAYEALQLAQSQVRRLVQAGQRDAAMEAAFNAAMTLLERHGRVAVASQLLALFVQVLNETQLPCTDAMVKRFAQLDEAYRNALERASGMDESERDRLGRLLLAFLRGGVKWSEILGTIRHGHWQLHELYGQQCWRMSDTTSAKLATSEEEAGLLARDDTEQNYPTTIAGLRVEAVTHLALAEKPLQISELLQKLPPPTSEETSFGHSCPPAPRDALLTQAVIVLVALENLRDANLLVQEFMEKVETRKAEDLAKSYMNKTDGTAPAHVTFCSMLLRVVEKEVKTAPLYSWLLRSFGTELQGMYKPEQLKAYTTKIGRVYFNIQPPPNMMNALENMMSMMGGGGGMGGIDPAMMQAALAAQGRG